MKNFVGVFIFGLWIVFGHTMDYSGRCIRLAIECCRGTWRRLRKGKGQGSGQCHAQHQGKFVCWGCSGQECSSAPTSDKSAIDRRSARWVCGYPGSCSQTRGTSSSIQRSCAKGSSYVIGSSFYARLHLKSRLAPPAAPEAAPEAPAAPEAAVAVAPAVAPSCR